MDKGTTELPTEDRLWSPRSFQGSQEIQTGPPPRCRLGKLHDHWCIMSGYTFHQGEHPSRSVSTKTDHGPKLPRSMQCPSEMHQAQLLGSDVTSCRTFPRPHGCLFVGFSPSKQHATSCFSVGVQLRSHKRGTHHTLQNRHIHMFLVSRCDCVIWHHAGIAIRSNEWTRPHLHGSGREQLLQLRAALAERGIRFRVRLLQVLSVFVTSSFWFVIPQGPWSGCSHNLCEILALGCFSMLQASGSRELPLCPASSVWGEDELPSQTLPVNHKGSASSRCVLVRSWGRACTFEAFSVQSAACLATAITGTDLKPLKIAQA